MSLKLHINSHDGLKLFKCEECGKGYGSRLAPQWHMKIHTRLKPYGFSLVYLNDQWSWKETHVWHSEWKGFCKKSTVIDIIVEREVWGERECFPFEFFPLFTGCLLENDKEGQNQFIVGKWELFRIILFVTIIIWSDFLACQEIWIFNPFWSKPI